MLTTRTTIGPLLVLLATVGLLSVYGQAAAPVGEALSIPMRDGAELVADLYLPEAYSEAAYPDGVPVVLVCTPYGKRRGKAVDFWRATLLAHGYAFVVQDMRGFHGSAEAGKGTPRRFDGYDTIEWLAAQPWCNGKVGMLGYSHPGSAQYEAAVTAPPQLACAIPAQAPGNYYTDAYYPATFRKADMETIWRGPFSVRTTLLINRRIRNRQTSHIPHFRTPMLHSAGWYDFYKEGAIEMFLACQADGGDGARGQQKLLIGPWGHGAIQEEQPGQPLTLPGGLSYPANSKPNWPKEVWLPWFDYWLKGVPTGVMAQPAVRYYLMGDVDDSDAPGNVWIEAETFPPASTPIMFFAHADHTLRREAPTADEAIMQYAYDPRDPVPSVGRFHARLPVNGPFDQREVEGREDVLLFTTPALDAPLTIIGQVRVRLWAASDQPDTDFTAKLTDVYPDGRSMLFLDSIVKGRYRNSYLKAESLSPGQICEFDIDLGYIALVLAPGHRLRLAISSSNFDRFDLNPNTGEPYGDHAMTRALLEQRLRAERSRGEPEYHETRVATQTVYMDRARPTHVVLPVVDMTLER